MVPQPSFEAGNRMSRSPLEVRGLCVSLLNNPRRSPGHKHLRQELKTSSGWFPVFLRSVWTKRESPASCSLQFGMSDVPADSSVTAAQVSSNRSVLMLRGLFFSPILRFRGPSQLRRFFPIWPHSCAAVPASCPIDGHRFRVFLRRGLFECCRRRIPEPERPVFPLLWVSRSKTSGRVGQYRA